LLTHEPSLGAHLSKLIQKYLLKEQIDVDRTSVSPNEVPESVAVDVFDRKSGVADNAIARLLPNRTRNQDRQWLEF